MSVQAKDFTHLDSILEQTKASLNEYAKQYNKDPLSQETQTQVDKFDALMQVYVYSVFKEINGNIGVVTLNTVVKPVLISLAEYMQQEQALLEDLLQNKVAFDDSFKTKVSLIKATYQDRLEHLKLFSENKMVSDQIQEKIENVNKIIDEIETLKRSI